MSSLRSISWIVAIQNRYIHQSPPPSPSSPCVCHGSIIGSNSLCLVETFKIWIVCAVGSLSLHHHSLPPPHSSTSFSFLPFPHYSFLPLPLSFHCMACQMLLSSRDNKDLLVVSFTDVRRSAKSSQSIFITSRSSPTRLRTIEA